MKKRKQSKVDPPDERTSPEQTSRSEARFSQRVIVAVTLTASVMIFLFLFWQTIEIFLLIFAGILLAIALRGMSDWVSKRTFLSQGWSLTFVLIALLAIFVVGFGLLAPSIGSQVDQLSHELPRSIEELKERARKTEWGGLVLRQVPSMKDLFSDRDFLARATGFFSSTLGALATVLIVFVIAIYLAAEPSIYVQGFVRLVPISKRERILQVMHRIGYTLRWWLVGRLASMIIIGVLVSIGLSLLGVPMALALGLLAGLLDFIPNIGPVIAFIPAGLLALTQSPSQALYVALLYLGIQMFEGNLLTPFVERRTVSLPPALTITTQLFLGILLGGAGLLLATPLTAAIVVAVKMLYVEDILGDSSNQSTSAATPAPSLDKSSA